MKRFSAIMLMLGAIGNASAGCENVDARLNLKKWGLAYCIGTQVEGRTEQGGAAMGGYFQLGAHNSQDAYQHVRRFFDEWVARHPARASTSGTDLSLMTCINAYESDAYRRLVRQQDTYLPGPTVEP